eukprot:jgi/Mesvir1/10939/Mv11480-RA.1
MARRAIRESKYLMMRAMASDAGSPRRPVRRGSEWATDFIVARRDAETDPVRRETLQGFAEVGYKIVKNAIPLYTVHSLSVSADRFADKKVGIFQRKSRDGASSPGDHKRYQYAISHDQASGEFDIWRTCHSLVSTFFSSNHLVVNPCFLYSDAGCAQQSAHRDFLSDVHRWRSEFPVSAIVALEEGTRFVAFESDSRGNGVNETADDLEGYVTPREIALSPGSMVMWHGNLVHAGGAYPLAPNRRLFFSAVAVDDALSIPLDYTFHVSV